MAVQPTIKLRTSRRASRWSTRLCAITILVSLPTIGCTSSHSPAESSVTVESSSKAIIGNGYFGLLTTEKYQDTWQDPHCVDHWYYPEVCYAWEMAFAFGGIMDDHNTNLFSAGLDPDTGAYLQDETDGLSPRGVDLVDVLYLQTHGGVWDDYNSDYAMWMANSSVLTSWMRFGDNGRGMKLFVSWSCHTMQVDGHWWDRLGPLFRGGLKIMVGSHDLISWGNDMWETTRDFAGYMLDPASIDYAWYTANSHADWDQDVAITATGTTCDDCWARQGRTYDELLYDINGNMPILRDGQIGCACLAYWDDLGDG